MFVEEYMYHHWYQHDKDILIFDNSITVHNRRLEQANAPERVGYRIQFDYDNLIVHNESDNQRESEEFWNHLWVEIEGWKKLDLKANEKKVLDAIIILLKEPDSIEIFNKKAIYLYVREITDLNTKQVVNNLNKIRQKYKDFKKTWDNGEI